MWNEERGFGFLTPAGGGDDVFVHRSAVGEGISLSAGLSVTYQASWDDKKKKDRATSVVPAPSSDNGASSSASRERTERTERPARSQSQSAQAPRGEPREHHIVGAAGAWQISKQPMSSQGDETVVRHRLTIRSDAPKGDADTRREEFQVVGDGSWDQRLYPAGRDGEETVVLRPGSAPSKAANDRGKGHGRNWAVEGKPGASFDIIYDPVAKTVTCELVKA